MQFTIVNFNLNCSSIFMNTYFLSTLYMDGHNIMFRYTVDIVTWISSECATVENIYGRICLRIFCEYLPLLDVSEVYTCMCVCVINVRKSFDYACWLTFLKINIFHFFLPFYRKTLGMLYVNISQLSNIHKRHSLNWISWHINILRTYLWTSLMYTCTWCISEYVYPCIFLLLFYLGLLLIVG